MNEKTFLQELFDKRASVLKIGEQTGANVTSALNEVDRQIRQCLQGGDLAK